MIHATPKSRLRRVAVRSTRWGGVAMVLAGLAVYVCYRADRAVLREIASGIVEGIDSPAEQVLAVNTWVHWHAGFVANEQSFVVSRLGATPLQVVDDGGDCADKSRLVVALLTELDIPATSAMCFDPATGKPVHTVVEASLGGSEFIVVDPSYDLFFPKDEPGKFYGLVEMRRDATILTSRLHEITSARNFWMRVNGYRQDRSVYSLASTFNWEKNFITHAIRAALVRAMGDDVDRIYRPQLLEEPKLAVASVSIVVGVCMLLFPALQRRCATSKDVRAAECVAAASQVVTVPVLNSRQTSRDRRNQKILESV